MQATSRARRPDSGGRETAPPQVMIHFVDTDSRSHSSHRARSAQPSIPWYAWSAWPNHPAILPPLPRLTKAEAIAATTPTIAEKPALPMTPRPRRAVHAPTQPVRRVIEQPRPTTTRAQAPVQRRTRAVAAPARPAAPALSWPASFDDWMIDIVRRRALRLNSGARRRGVTGTVRAVELAHVLEKSVDGQGRWKCAICHQTVTLDDLSFDHVIALADGGEHAAHNLVPAHRKCNEIKGSEKAQNRANALDRWLSEWGAKSATGATPSIERRYA